MSLLDQAYQFFIDEVPELLEILENGILTLKEEKSTAKVHNLMRAAHSIKGGAASVGLIVIKNIAHKLEDYLKAFYNDDIAIDTELESILLDAYDALATPLLKKINEGNFDESEAEKKANKIWSKLEKKLGTSLSQVNDYVPSSSDLGIDIVASIFEVDIARENQRLLGLIASPEDFDPFFELSESLEILTGFAELLDLQVLNDLTSLANEALKKNPDKPLAIAKLLVIDLQNIREKVLQGEKKIIYQMNSAMVALASGEIIDEEIYDINPESIDLTPNQDAPSYQFFIEEVPDLLSAIENGLLNIQQKQSLTNLDEVVDLIHSIKTGSASVGLTTIKNLAHNLEKYVSRIADDHIALNTEIEEYLLKGYDCLKESLEELLHTGNCAEDKEHTAEPIWQWLEKHLSHPANNNFEGNGNPESKDLTGIMFQSDITQNIEQLNHIIHTCSSDALREEVRFQAEIISGLGEMLDNSNLKTIASTTLQSLDTNPKQVKTIAQSMLDRLVELSESVLATNSSNNITTNIENSENLTEEEEFTEEFLEISDIMDVQDQESFEMLDNIDEQDQESFEISDIMDVQDQGLFEMLDNIDEQDQESFEMLDNTDEQDQALFELLDNIDEQDQESFELSDNIDEQDQESFELSDNIDEQDQESFEMLDNIDEQDQTSEESQSEQKALEAQSYQFFIEEAEELLEMIDSGLQTLFESRSMNTVHDIARAAHSLKGGARSAGLEDLGNIAFRVEKSFKVFYNEEIIIDEFFQGYLPEIYETLRLPIIARLHNRLEDEKVLLDKANALWEKLEDYLGDRLTDAEEYLPSSSDLGIDITNSIFEIDVAENIKTLTELISEDDPQIITETLTNQIEILLGFAEMLSLPGFLSICQSAMLALESNPHLCKSIAQCFLNDIKLGATAVLAGDRTEGGKPSAELLALTEESSFNTNIENVIGELDETDENEGLSDEFLAELTANFDSSDEDLETAEIENNENILADWETMIEEEEVLTDSENVSLEEEENSENIFMEWESEEEISEPVAIEKDTEVSEEEYTEEPIDTNNQAYRLFIEESSELLEKIESGLLNLKQERNPNKVHEIMRAAHSIKGGAASVGLDAIKSIAHKLEDYFKCLYDDKVEIDTDLETWLLEGFDCLSEPLTDIMNNGYYNPQMALNKANQLWQQIDTKLGDSVEDSKNRVMSGSDLGVDMVAEMFRVDVQNELDSLKKALTNPEGGALAGELRATLEVFAGFGEMLELPGFASIGKLGLTAIDLLPDNVINIISVIIRDVELAREQVLKGDRSKGGEPSPELLKLSKGEIDESLNDDESEGIDLIDWESIESIDELDMDDFDESESNLTQFNSKMSEDNEEKVDYIPEIQDVLENVDEEEVISLETVFSLSDLDENDLNNENIDTEEEEKESEDSAEDEAMSEKDQQSILEAIQSLSDVYDFLPNLNEDEEKLTLQTNLRSELLPQESTQTQILPSNNKELPKTTINQSKTNLTIRVDLERLERMNNLIGELSINRNSLSLQNDKLQDAVKELVNRFSYFNQLANSLRGISDQMLVNPDRFNSSINRDNSSNVSDMSSATMTTDNIEVEEAFDSLEMDTYNSTYNAVQSLIEQMIQLEESVDDISLFAKQSQKTAENQRQMLNSLRNELMWARMLPLSEILNRFPRVLRDLSVKHKKQVNLKLTGTSVLVDKAALEKLYDPLVHLLRNAFDHGIEENDVRTKNGKPPQGTIEIKAYHQGNQTVIEVIDDGGGLNLDKIGKKALEKGLLSSEQLAVTKKEDLLDLIFQPGFSTAKTVTDISGRGVGLDIVRSQLQSLKGTITVTSTPSQGTVFILRLPLTLTIDKLLVLLVGNNQLALPSDNIYEILIPDPNNIKTSSHRRFLHYSDEIIPIYYLIDLLNYNCPIDNSLGSKTVSMLPVPEDWAKPLLLLKQGQQLFALEVDSLVSEQELVIKPFGEALSPPRFAYGCTILGDGSLIPVINGSVLLEKALDKLFTGVSFKKQINSAIQEPNEHSANNQTYSKANSPQDVPKRFYVSSVLVIDDSAAMRRTLALSLEKSGYRVLQAKDGKEGLDLLSQSSNIDLVICDIEMPNMNGFEFLGQRRRNKNMMKIPVAMLTSRSNDKHRKLATQLGANAYFTKPYIEQKFLASIKNMMKKESVVSS